MKVCNMSGAIYTLAKVYHKEISKDIKKIMTFLRKGRDGHDTAGGDFMCVLCRGYLTFKYQPGHTKVCTCRYPMEIQIKSKEKNNPMKITGKEKISTYLKYHQHVMVRIKTKQSFEFCVVSHFKDRDGNFISSGWFHTDLDAMDNIGDGGGEPLYQFDELQIQSITPFDLPLEQYQVGQEVIVREDAKEWCERLGFQWNLDVQQTLESKTKEVMVGKKYKIRDCYNGFYVLDANLFPQQALNPVLDSTPTLSKEEFIKLGTECGYLEEGKVVR